MKLGTFQELVDYICIYGDKTAFNAARPEGGYRKVTYEELLRNAKNFASYLGSVKHIAKGDKVAFCSANNPDWFQVYYGIVFNGIWAVPFDAKLTPKEIKNLLLDSGAKIFVVTKEVFQSIASDPDIAGHVNEFIVIDPDAETLKHKKVVSLADALEKGSKHALKRAKVEPSDVASLLYTSGTTGKPKGVMLTHGNLIRQADAISKLMTFDTTDTELAVLPLHHTFEFSVENTMLLCGSAITYAESFKPNKLFANIVDTHVTIMVAVPAFYEKIYDGIMRNIRSMKFPVKQILLGLYGIVNLVNLIRRDNKAGIKVFGFLRKKANLSNIRFMVCGAAPLNHKVARGLEAMGLNVLNGYGLTEASPILTGNRVGMKIINESVGIPLEGVELKIVNPDKEGHGEIFARSPGIMKGYYNNPEATNETLTEDGWLHTGDIGKIETHAGSDYLYISGRSKNVIVTTGGKNVYPEEIEELLNHHQMVAESLVIGVPQSEHSKGENIFALIVPDYEYFNSLAIVQGIKHTEQHIQHLLAKLVKEVNNQLKSYQMICGFHIHTEGFPKTSTLKIKRFMFAGSEFKESLRRLAIYIFKKPAVVISK